MSSDDEIIVAIKSFDPSKAPGYDSFNIKFLLNMWDIVGNDILTFVKAFFQTSQFPPNINTTWATLIPKSVSANIIEEFRHVSIVGSLYKIIYKVFASRLKQVMGNDFRKSGWVYWGKKHFW